MKNVKYYFDFFFFLFLTARRGGSKNLFATTPSAFQHYEIVTICDIFISSIFRTDVMCVIIASSVLISNAIL